MKKNELPQQSERLRSLVPKFTVSPTTLYSVIMIEVLLIFVWALNFNTMEDADTWMHIELGRYMVTEMKLITQDIYTATLAGKPYVAYEWLAQIIFYIFSDRTGETLTYFKFVVMLLGSIITGIFLIKHYWNGAITLLVTATMAYLIAFRAQVRPELFALWALMGIMVALDRWRRDKVSTYLWAVVPLEIIWVNTHGSYVMGPALMIMISAILWAQLFIPQLSGWNFERSSHAEVKTFTIIAAATLGATLINPYGIILWQKTLGVFGESKFLVANIREWNSIYQVRKGEYWVRIWTIWIIAGWVFMYLNFARRSLVDVALMVLATLLPFMGIRHVSVSAILSFPVLLRNGYDVWPQTRFRYQAISASVLILATTYTTVFGNCFSDGERKGIGAGFGYTWVPMDIMQYLAEKKLAGSIFHNYSDGSYIMYYLWPQNRPVIDSRTDLFGEQYFMENKRAFESIDAMQKYIDKYHLSLAILELSDRYQMARQYFMNHPDWQLEKVGSSRVLFAKKILEPGPRPLLDRFPQSASSKPREAPLVINPEICRIARLLGHCVAMHEQSKMCDSYCNESEIQTAQALGSKDGSCKDMITRCGEKEVACGSCKLMCLSYAEAAPALNSILGTTYAPPATCGP